MSIATITGSTGLIGSESVHFFAKLGFDIVGIDNDMRSFFGQSASTKWNWHLLKFDTYKSNCRLRVLCFLSRKKIY